MARLHLTFYINAFFLVSHVLHYIACQQCETDHYSIYQRMLQGYTFKALKMQSGSLECRQACLADIRCQSYNVVFKGICELNNRTKEARPENFVKDLGRYYKQRDFKRAPLGSIRELPAISCKEIKASEGGQAVSGYYWLDLIRSGDSFLTYCDMVKEEINECADGSHNCHRDATCQNTVGGYKCTCRSEYIGNGLTCKPRECINYAVIFGSKRKRTYKSKQPYLDDGDLNGWYRFQGQAGTKMATSCVPFKRCGGLRPGWLKGGHPSKEDGRVNRRVYFRSFNNCEEVFNVVKVRNCGPFFVYFIRGTAPGTSNPERYCGSD
ncbi:uromodulin-like [Pocillopora verrucosa]|uniref:uromodulin-like n=1 Tax=Pocillopora verrucosa TaxID=203993 RepID=UPI0033409F0A